MALESHPRKSGLVFSPVQLDTLGGMGFGATPTVPWDEMEAEAGEREKGEGMNRQVLHPNSQTPRILAFGQSFATTAYAVHREQ